ncbi:DUF4012 domain-containing protein [Nocardioides sp.]|uniref:DUF4012 domain-containing protein n=1 Tax=Nocardioides sp. TaxID=35761 RepID=UPI001A359E92|nr:DUF4012 domain-containing protein [Nocardioides sp.]MBJ7357272.1 DUF4012 domain-containing protein [Nocardioides sp.]
MRSRVVRLSLLGAFVVMLALGLWTGWQAWRVNEDLNAAVDAASDLEAALEGSDQPAAEAALDDLDEHTAAAHDRTEGVTFGALARLPVLGDDVTGVRVATDVINDLTDEALRPLVDEAADLESFLPREGQVPVDRLADLQAPVARAHAAFAEATTRLDGEDSSSYAGPLKSKYRDLARRVRDAAGTLETADTALQVMPDMLGRSGERNYLLVFQNNAEVRSTGGLPGAVSVLNVNDGRLALTRQVAASSLGNTEQPVLPLTEAEEQIYGPQLGIFFLDANFTPDFPRTADLMKARWEQEFDDEIDGVLAVDPVALSYLLAVTGPVQAGDVEINSDNAVDELLHQVYLRNEIPADQDEYFKQVTRAVFDKVTSGVGDPQAILRALGDAGDENRLYVHSFAEEEQRALAGTDVAGELVKEPTERPQVGVYLNDTTASKMSYFLRTKVRVDSTSCSGDAQVLDGLARLRSVAPADAGETLPDYVTGGGNTGLEPGSQLVAVRLYAPVEGEFERVTLNGEEILADLDVVVHDGRPVASTFVFLGPQETVDLAWRMRGGPGQTGDVAVSVTPGIEPGDASSSASSSC